MRLNREVGDSLDGRDRPQQPRQRRRGLGDYAAARRHYAESLRVYRDYDDRWALAFLLEDVARARGARRRVRARALELLGAADALREEIGAPRGPSLEEEIAEAIEPAVSTLADDVREAARARGRALDRDRAIAVALSTTGAT